MDGAGSNSPYTEALANGMRQPGVDVLRMFNQVGLQVKRSTGGSQQPWVSPSPIDGDFYFQRVSTEPVVPAPAPALPAQPLPPPVAQAAPDQIEPVLAAMRGFGCSVLDAKRVGNQIEVRGLVLNSPDWSN